MSQKVKEESITVKQAREELSESEFFAFCRWLRDRGYTNLQETTEGSFKHEIFATKEQLNRFLKEHGKDPTGVSTSTTLLGQTREFLQSKKKKIK